MPMRFVRPRKPRRDDAFPVVWSPRLLALCAVAPEGSFGATVGSTIGNHGKSTIRTRQAFERLSRCAQPVFRTRPFSAPRSKTPDSRRHERGIQGGLFMLIADQTVPLNLTSMSAGLPAPLLTLRWRLWLLLPVLSRWPAAALSQSLSLW